MRSFLPLAVCCISLVSLQQLSASPAGTRPNRLDLLSELIGQKEETSSPSGSQTKSVSTPSATSRPAAWLPGFLRRPVASGTRTASPGPAWAEPAEASQVKRRAKRSRGQAHSRGGQHYPKNAQVMRVGCVLGTCQVQNLSHRLYQLVGQSGREDSSPINPRSPHSFG